MRTSRTGPGPVLCSHPMTETHRVPARERAGRVLTATPYDGEAELPEIAAAAPEDPRGIDGDVRGHPCSCGSSCGNDSGCDALDAPAPGGADPRAAQEP